MPQVTRSVYDAIADPAVSLAGRHPAVAAREPVDRAVADRARQARGEAGGGDGRALPAEGQDRAAPRDVSRTSSSTARRRSGLLTVNALVAATHLLIPIQSSYFALEGTDDLLETIEKVRGAAQPGAADPRRRHHDARQAHGAGARHPGADPEGVRRQGLQDRDHQERAARGEPGLQGIDLHVRARFDRARPSTTACARRSSTVPRRGLPRRHGDAPRRALRRGAGGVGRRRRSAAWSPSTRSTRTRTSRARSWATCPS